MFVDLRALSSALTLFSALADCAVFRGGGGGPWLFFPCFIFSNASYCFALAPGPSCWYAYAEGGGPADAKFFLYLSAPADAGGGSAFRLAVGAFGGTGNWELTFDHGLPLVPEAPEKPP